MDQIIIKDLTVFANHGVFEAEAALGQKFQVSAVIGTDVRRPGLTDTLENTIHYGFVCQDITQFLTEHRFQLIEACAEQLAGFLLQKYYPQMREIELEIKKPWAPVHLPLDTVSVKIKRGWHTAFLAMGSNLGDKEGYLNFGVEELKKLPQVKVQKVSSFITTEPYGYTDQDVFCNGACMIETTLLPEELLDACNRIEADAQRVRLIHWGPRTLDLDVLFYDKEIIDSPRLNVPHVDLENRDFVLRPMAEIAPWWVHPQTGKTMKRMLEELEKRNVK